MGSRSEAAKKAQAAHLARVTGPIPEGQQELTQRQVSLLTGLSRSSLDKLERSGKFPARYQVPGLRAVRWNRAEIDVWRANRLRGAGHGGTDLVAERKAARHG